MQWRPIRRIFFFFQAEDGIRDLIVTGVQTCALPIFAPLALSGLEQRPIAGSQTPASWHWSLGGHSTGLVPVHTPARQASASVQALPSSHAVRSEERRVGKECRSRWSPYH